MSASREKKARQEQLANGYVDPRAKRAQEEKAMQRRSSILYISVAVAFVIVAIIVVIANSKVIQRNADAVTIGSETYSAADVDYHYYTIYNSFVRQNSSYLSLYGLDTSKSLKDQDCIVNDGTWYEYFRDQALESLKSYALLAQAAEAAGFDGSEYVENYVTQTYEEIDAYAAANNTTRAQYITAVCGPLVNQKVFDRNIRMMALAEAYSSDYSNSLSYTDAEVQAAYDVEEAKQKAETALERYAQGEAFDAIGEDMEGTYNHIAYAENGTSEMLTWACDDARAEGDTTVAAYDETGYYAVLFHSRTRNDYHTVSVRHILVSDEDKAKDILQQYNDGEKTEDAFAALAAANSTDSNASSGGLYANISKGDMVASFEDWCFDPARQSGDVEIVETSYGFHVMYFVETNPQPCWYYKADLDLKSNAYTEWYNGITDGVEVEQLDGMKYVG